MKIDIRRVDGWPLYRGTFTLPIGSSEYYTVEGAGDTEAETRQDVVAKVKAMIMRLQEFCALNGEVFANKDLNDLVREARGYGDYSVDKPMHLMQTMGGRIAGTAVQVPAGEVLVKGNLIEILSKEEDPYFSTPDQDIVETITEIQPIERLVNNPRHACVMTLNNMRVHFSYGGSPIKGAPLSFYYRAQYVIDDAEGENCVQLVFDADHNPTVMDWIGNIQSEVPAGIQFVIDCLIKTEKAKDMNAGTKELRMALAQQETQNEDTSVDQKDS